MNDQKGLSYWVLKCLGFLGRVFLGILLGMFVIFMAHRLQKWTSIEHMAEYVYYAVILIAIGITAYTRKFGLVTGLILVPSFLVPFFFGLGLTLLFLRGFGPGSVSNPILKWLLDAILAGWLWLAIH